MKTVITSFIILVFLAQAVFASDINKTNVICDSGKMDRIARAVVQDSQLRADDDQRSQEEKSWRQRHPVGFGSLLGFGIGFSFILVMAAGSGSTDYNVPLAGLFYGGIGAGIGAVIGSFF
jgi:hypothetical protein